MRYAALFRGYGILGAVSGVFIVAFGLLSGGPLGTNLAFAGVATVVLSAALVGVARVTDEPVPEDPSPSAAPDTRRRDPSEGREG